ncbi:hypothetical protein FB567DRAFT_511265 [Paraphoma chrysanthemicola]|uniref:Uncharacterized protein n=1 Tax=Paraphoma chrysanthemicola TaxID=798071 RepID=A0A8K0RH11_9PLEO|nr:hypothetical protein FB567DRAFT_511265 [Paraphoma chrysanthemicola]
MNQASIAAQCTHPQARCALHALPTHTSHHSRPSNIPNRATTLSPSKTALPKGAQNASHSLPSHTHRQMQGRTCPITITIDISRPTPSTLNKPTNQIHLPTYPHRITSCSIHARNVSLRPFRPPHVILPNATSRKHPVKGNFCAQPWIADEKGTRQNVRQERAQGDDLPCVPFALGGRCGRVGGRDWLVRWEVGEEWKGDYLFGKVWVGCGL